jgi:hypothetical protein
MMNWPNKFLIWSSTSTLALCVGQIVGNYWPVTSRHKPGKIVKLSSWFSYIENYNWGIIEYIIQLMTVCDHDNDFWWQWWK